MGARPIALMDPLRFGPLSDARSRWIAEGVVRDQRLWQLGRCAHRRRETVFDETYQDNPLVNVFCLGVLPVDRLVLGRASGVGNLAVLFGSTTERDGIGGVSVLASAGFGDDEADAAKRPSVQVGDPFEEKRLIEACLEMLDANLVVGIQDLGGAGSPAPPARPPAGAGWAWTCTCRRSPAGGRHGGVRGPHQREPGADAGHRRARAPGRGPGHLRPVGDHAAVVGTVTAGGRLRILDRPDGGPGRRAGSVAARGRPAARPARAEPALREARLADSADAALAVPRTRAPTWSRLYDTAWVSSQYDSQLFLNTVEGPGEDATVLRLKHPVTGPTPAGPGPHLRRQPPLVRSIPGGARPWWWPRRWPTWPAWGPAAGAGELPQLRQPHPSRGRCGAVRGHRRHGRGLPGPLHCRWWAAT